MTLSTNTRSTLNLGRTADKTEHMALSALDFYIRKQVIDPTSPDYGRYPFVCQCDTGEVTSLSTNWTTGVLIQALLIAARHTGKDQYTQSALHAIQYLYSLQVLDDQQSPMCGAFHEQTPDDSWMHPRDSLTAAWALLEYGQRTGDEQALERAELFGRWFVQHAMRAGYPAWTARFDDQKWEPDWLGSFHSGSAAFLIRLARHTNDVRYLEAARLILNIYNQHLLSPDGSISVLVDRHTHRKLDGQMHSPWTNRPWEVMHVYNDDFGALANLTMYHHSGDIAYRDAADRFLKHMAACQQPDGGFGPPGKSIPSAGGMVLIEWWLGRHCGLSPCTDEQFMMAINYLESIHVKRECPATGAFLGFDMNYQLDGNTANIRSGSYAIMALLMVAGAIDPTSVLEGGA